jgi:RNA ligase
VTLTCRGLVTDTEGNIVARPFKKFFNMEELSDEQIPKQDFDVYEKLDGSLGILFNYKNQWIICSRGSFMSEQAIKAGELLKKYDLKYFYYDYTFIFEIIYKENVIVVNYGDTEDLVLLGVIHTQNGTELPYNELIKISKSTKVPVVKKYDICNDYTSLKNLVGNNEEGFVIYFKNGFRMKIKGEEYCRLHFEISNVSNRVIWERLKNNQSFDDLLELIPDEFYPWVEQTKNELLSEYKRVFKELDEEFYKFINIKDFALKVKDTKLSGYMFKRLKTYSKEYEDMIWDIVYPALKKPFYL